MVPSKNGAIALNPVGIKVVIKGDETDQQQEYDQKDACSSSKGDSASGRELAFTFCAKAVR
jgi:hypothetical protein